MKTSLTLTIAALALTGTLGQATTQGSAASTNSANGDSALKECQITDSTFITELAPLAPMALDCQSKSGFNFVPPSTTPDSDQTSKICSECDDLIEKAKNFDAWPQCTFDIDGEMMSVEDLFTKIASNCGSVSGSGSTSAMATSSGDASVVDSAADSAADSPTDSTADSLADSTSTSTADSTAESTADSASGMSSDSASMGSGSDGAATITTTALAGLTTVVAALAL